MNYVHSLSLDISTLRDKSSKTTLPVQVVPSGSAFVEWHTLRHSYRSLLDAAGAPVGEVKQLLIQGRMRLATDGDTEILDAFWNPELDRTEKRLAPHCWSMRT
jgi:hypothetical protein